MPLTPSLTPSLPIEFSLTLSATEKTGLKLYPI